MTNFFTDFFFFTDKVNIFEVILHHLDSIEKPLTLLSGNYDILKIKDQDVDVGNAEAKNFCILHDLESMIGLLSCFKNLNI